MAWHGIRTLLAAGVLLSSVGAQAANVSLTVNEPLSDPNVTVAVTFIGTDSDTQSVQFSGAADTDINLGTDPTFGTVATQVEFNSAAIAIADTDFMLTVPPIGDLTISVVGWNATLAGGPLVPTPTAANTVEIALDTVDLLTTTGEIIVDSDATGPSPVPADNTRIGFDPGTVGTVVTSDLPGGETSVTVTLPLAFLVSVTEQGVTVDLTFAGNLVLEGTIVPIPPVPVPLLPYQIR